MSENLYEPDTPTITCPACGETLLYGVKSCRFCQHAINPVYAKKSVAAQAILTQAIKSANTIRTLRNLLYLQLGLTIVAFLWDPSYLYVVLIVSIINLFGPIRWLRKYGRGDLDNAEIVKAQKDMKIELYFWLGAIIFQSIAIFIWWIRL